MRTTKTWDPEALMRPCTLATLVLGLTFAGPGAGWAQTDDFNSGTASNWGHLDLSEYLPSAFVSYNFPPDGNGGKAYQIQLLPTPPDALGLLGPARSLSYWSNVTYTGRFEMSIEVLAWNNDIDQAFGPFWYADNLQLGGVTGYVFTYDPIPQELLLSKITNEQRSTLAKVSNVVLTPGNRYRFAVSSADGTTYLAQVFSTSDPKNPLWSTIAQDSAYNSGKLALLAFDGSDLAADGTDVTFDNYAAAVPPANSMGPIVTGVSPASGEKVTSLYPTITAGILDRDTTVDTSRILFWLDDAIRPGTALTPGVQLPGNNNSFSGATLSFTVSTLLPPGSQHTNRLAYADSRNNWRTNEWVWTSAYPMLWATNSLPLSSAGARGLNVRLVRAASSPILPNSVDTAELQLATPSPIPSVFSTNYTGGTLNYAKDISFDPAGVFVYDGNFPGIDPADCVNVALEATAWLALPAGVCQFGVLSDDGFKLTSGAGVNDANATVLGYFSGGPYNGTFQFAVEAAGLYPVHFVFNQAGSDAHVQLYSVDPGTTVSTLINDSIPGAIPGYVSYTALESAPLLSPTSFTIERSAVIDTNAQTITVPKSASQRFYRIATTGSAPKITGIRQSGSNMVLTYQ